MDKLDRNLEAVLTATDAVLAVTSKAGVPSPIMHRNVQYGVREIMIERISQKEGHTSTEKMDLVTALYDFASLLTALTNVPEKDLQEAALHHQTMLVSSLKEMAKSIEDSLADLK